jgi:hypothetical protein
MKNRTIFPSVAQLVSFEAVKTGVNLKDLSKMKPSIRSTNIILYSKCIEKAGYQ